MTGPLPAAKYLLSGCTNVMHGGASGPRPCSFILKPLEPGKMCGRSDFLIHGCTGCTSGDHSQPPVNGCSAGCVVINFENRIKLRPGDTLTVISYEPKKGHENLTEAEYLELTQ